MNRTKPESTSYGSHCCQTERTCCAEHLQ